MVDNNSKDDTRERVERFAAEHPELNLRYVFEQKQGLSHARNAGIMASTGDIVAFIDDDERIVPQFIEAYITLFDNYPSAMAAGGKIVAEYPTGRPRWMSHYTELPIANPMDFGEEVMLFPRRRIPGGGNMAMRRRVFDIIGMFDTSLGRTGKKLIGGEANVAFLSFSSKSGDNEKDESIVKVKEAARLTKLACPELNVDGELQLDCALDAGVAKIKAPNSPVAGKANILIFPDLDSANIGYKLVSRFAGIPAIGVILQGVNKPVNDLSRGAEIDEICSMIAITALS